MRKAAALAMAAFMATGILGGVTMVYAEESSAGSVEDYSADLPSDYEGTLTMWGWDDAWFEALTTAFQEK